MISTGQYYYNARWYDPQLGRFTTEDPIRYGLNWYAYANNNPLKFVDPTGLSDWNITINYVNPKTDTDKSFERAARTSVKGSNIRIPVTTETEFKEAWAKLSNFLKDNNDTVSNVSIFSHAGKEGDTGELYFARSDNDDGTLTANEIKDLAKLPYNESGNIDLKGCNTGKGENSAAQNFADSQGVPTSGQMGYAYFSETEGKYKESDSNSEDLYLEAYNRGKNNPIGMGQEIPDTTATPKETKTDAE